MANAITRVNVDTLRGQLLYEIQGLYYYNPDVIADLTYVTIQQAASDQVRLSGVRGENICPRHSQVQTKLRRILGIAPPETLKIAIMAVGGYQAEFSVYVTGLHAKEKALSFEKMARRIVDVSKLDVLDFQLYGTPTEDPKNQLEATLQLRVLAQSRDPTRLTPGRFLGPMMSNQLQGYPGLTANLDYRTAEPKLICTYFPGLFDRRNVHQVIHFVEDPSRTIAVPDTATFTPRRLLPKQRSYETANAVPLADFRPTKHVPLGSVVFARSGDKGSNVNVGFFFPAGKGMKLKYDWLRSFLTIETLRCEFFLFTPPIISPGIILVCFFILAELEPPTALDNRKMLTAFVPALLAEEAEPDIFIERCEFPNIQAVNFIVHGLLGAGVSSSVKMDSLGKVRVTTMELNKQLVANLIVAKNLAEYLKARHVDVPATFLTESSHM